MLNMVGFWLGLTCFDLFTLVCCGNTLLVLGARLNGLFPSGMVLPNGIAGAFCTRSGSGAVRRPVRALPLRFLLP